MTSTSTRVSKTVVTRSPRDIDPKVAISAAIVAVADLVLVVLFVVGRIDAETLIAGTGPSAVAVLGAYLKRSTHVDPDEALDAIHGAIEVAGPIIADVAPAAAPAVAVVEDAVDTVRRLVAAPVDPTASAK